MTGPVLRGEPRVSWASRVDSPPQRRTSQQSSASQNDSSSSSQQQFLSPSERRYDDSPMAMPASPDLLALSPADEVTTPRTQYDVPGRDFMSAPAEMIQPHDQLSRLRPTPGHPIHTFDTQPIRVAVPSFIARKPDIQLDPTVPIRVARERGNSSTSSSSLSRSGQEGSEDEGVGKRRETIQETPLEAVKEEDERTETMEKPGQLGVLDNSSLQLGETAASPSSHPPAQDTLARDEGPVWGESFKVQWIRTERLPFTRTRHLRNPWNHDREVKVSRDGTELEPSVGQALLDEWDRPDPAASPTDERHPAPETTSTDPEVSTMLSMLSTQEMHQAGEEDG